MQNLSDGMLLYHGSYMVVDTSKFYSIKNSRSAL